MSYLISSVPQFKVLVRKPFLYNCEDHYGELIEGYIFGVKTIPGRALMFEVLLENGAVFSELPIHAFVDINIDRDMYPLIEKVSSLQLWDSPSYHHTVMKYDVLAGLNCRVYLPRISKTPLNGRYMFTIDYAESPLSELPDEHKATHIIKLDIGVYCAQPNNRVLFSDASFTKHDKIKPDYKINKQIWVCEGNEETSYEYFYEQDKDNEAV